LDGTDTWLYAKQPYAQSNWSDVYTALVDRSTAAIGQIGWDVYPGGSRDSFVEGATGTSIWYPKKTFAAPPLSAVTEFKVTYSASAFHTFEGGASEYTMSFPNYAGCSVETSGETHDANNQMPGSVSSPEYWSDSTVRYNGTTWYTPTGSEWIGARTTNDFTDSPDYQPHDLR
jgi:hypothetical protein